MNTMYFDHIHSPKEKVFKGKTKKEHILTYVLAMMINKDGIILELVKQNIADPRYLQTCFNVKGAVMVSFVVTWHT